MIETPVPGPSTTTPYKCNISEDRVRYIAEMPVKDKTTEEWLKGNAAYLASTKLGGRSLISWDRYSDSSAVLACLLGPI